MTIGRPTLLILGIACATGPLSAQERPSELTGCYDITADSLKVGRGSGYDSEVPPRIEFAGQFPGFGDGDILGTQIVVPEGALPSVHSLMWGEIVGDSLKLVFSTGFGGVRATLAWTGDHWAGSARFRSDVTPHESYAGPIELTPVSCDSAPPVSSDAMLPITRSVELEGGLVHHPGRTASRSSGDDSGAWNHSDGERPDHGALRRSGFGSGGGSRAAGSQDGLPVLHRHRCSFQARDPFPERLWRPRN